MRYDFFFKINPTKNQNIFFYNKQRYTKIIVGFIDFRLTQLIVMIIFK